MSNLTHLQEENLALAFGSDRWRGFPKLLRGKTRQVPHQGKAILLRAITSHKNWPPIRSFTDDRLTIEKKMVVVKESLKGKTWLEVIDLWLTTAMVINLMRTLVPIKQSRKAMGFMIVLRSCKGDPSECDALKEAFSSIIKKLTAQFFERFTFDIYKGKQLEALEKPIRSGAFFNKMELDVKRDLLIVIHEINIRPFCELIDGGEEEEEEEEEEEDEEDGGEVEHRHTDDDVSFGVLEQTSDLNPTPNI